MEIWKDIKDYEGLYQVSNTGKVKSLIRCININNSKIRIVPEKLLKGMYGKYIKCIKKRSLSI